MSLLQELKRRKVVRTTLAYLGAAFITAQAAQLLVDGLDLPDWIFKAVLAALFIGLPLVVALAWAFDVTPAGIERTGDDATTSPSPDAQRAPRIARRSALAWVLAISATAAAIAVAAWLAVGSVFTRKAPTFERIAVLPMDNQTGDTTQAFFADGMTRELIGVLSDAGVRVLGHRAVVQYRNSTMSTAEIASALSVDAIVTGAVLKSGDVVQISAELIDPRSEESLWARSFSRSAADVVMLQHDVAREIARGIRARLTPDQSRSLAAAQPVDPKAYTQYLLGQEQASLRTPSRFQAQCRVFPPFHRPRLDVRASVGGACVDQCVRAPPQDHPRRLGTYYDRTGVGTGGCTRRPPRRSMVRARSGASAGGLERRRR